MRGELSREEIEDVLRREVVGRIGCFTGEWPYVVPVTYAYDGEVVYVHSADGMKLHAMRERPNVCFEVEQIRGPSDWRTVIAKGRFEDLWRDPDQYTMKLLASRYAPEPKSAGAGEGSPVAHTLDPPRPHLYRIRLLERTGRFEQS
jgi:nitroimidazol reductase NimA-like FMN-containing flavoprotein (pyridoxamine 5'-phosphate oxidase superfamily)